MFLHLCFIICSVCPNCVFLSFLHFLFVNLLFYEAVSLAMAYSKKMVSTNIVIEKKDTGSYIAHWFTFRSNAADVKCQCVYQNKIL